MIVRLIGKFIISEALTSFHAMRALITNFLPVALTVGLSFYPWNFL